MTRRQTGGGVFFAQDNFIQARQMPKKKKTTCYVVDDDIDGKLATAKAMLKSRKSKTKCLAPTEGDAFQI